MTLSSYVVPRAEQTQSDTSDDDEASTTHKVRRRGRGDSTHLARPCIEVKVFRLSESLTFNYFWAKTQNRPTKFLIEYISSVEDILRDRRGGTCTVVGWRRLDSDEHNDWENKANKQRLREIDKTIELDVTVQDLNAYQERETDLLCVRRHHSDPSSGKREMPLRVKMKTSGFAVGNKQNITCCRVSEHRVCWTWRRTLPRGRAGWKASTTIVRCIRLKVRVSEPSAYSSSANRQIM